MSEVIVVTSGKGGVGKTTTTSLIICSGEIADLSLVCAVGRRYR